MFFLSSTAAHRVHNKSERRTDIDCQWPSLLQELHHRKHHLLALQQAEAQVPSKSPPVHVDWKIEDPTEPSVSQPRALPEASINVLCR